MTEGLIHICALEPSNSSKDIGYVALSGNDPVDTLVHQRLETS
jgi:hypothetical protein